MTEADCSMVRTYYASICLKSVILLLSRLRRILQEHSDQDSVWIMGLVTSFHLQHFYALCFYCVSLILQPIVWPRRSLYSPSLSCLRFVVMEGILI